MNHTVQADAMSGQQQGHDKKDQESVPSIRQMENIWLKRSRGVLIGKYASDERVKIYGLDLQRVTGSSDLYDVFQIVETEDGEEEDANYIDTLNIVQFASARAILQQIRAYYPDEEDVPEEDEVEDDEEDPSPTFQ